MAGALPWVLDTYNIKVNENMNMMTFNEYVSMREGLWLNDKNAVVGLSKIAPPKPPKTARPTPPPKIKPVPAKPVGEAQMEDEIKKIIEKDKQRLSRRVVRTPSGSVTLEPQLERLPQRRHQHASNNDTMRA